MVFIALSSTHGIEYNSYHYHLRYNGHIINLAAQAFLFPINDAFSYENTTSYFPTERELMD